MNISEIFIRRPTITTLVICDQGKKPVEVISPSWLVYLGSMIITTIVALIGIGVITGLLWSRVSTLYLIPVLYTYMEAGWKKLSRLL
jgi:hypothetical protein